LLVEEEFDVLPKGALVVVNRHEAIDPSVADRLGDGLVSGPGSLTNIDPP
jgi:hypothetical protein